MNHKVMVAIALLCSMLVPGFVGISDATTHCRVKKGAELKRLERAAKIRVLTFREHRRFTRLQNQFRKAKQRCGKKRIIDPVVTPAPTGPTPPGPRMVACEVPDQRYVAITDLNEVTDPRGMYFLCNDAQGRFGVSEFEGEFNGGGHRLTVRTQNLGSPVAAGLVEVIRPSGSLHNFHLTDSIVQSGGFSGLVAGVSAGSIDILSITRSKACSPAGYAGVVGLRFGGSLHVRGASDLSTECD